mmetsp:Transcript_15256/g.23214  ORF Transcript_15256/g.23214 Transcript_15256/m.23214 type:complete len:233 (+) Transcript_15256:2223-2921(+)
MTVMLSPPIPCETLGSSLTIWSSISVPISMGVFSSILSRTNLTASSFVKQSHMPSHPKIINSSPSSKVTCTISGSAVMIWSAGAIPWTCLYLRSPIDRERLRFPLILPNWLTNPPAFVIRFISRSCMGLWSKLRASAIPPSRHKTALESPALATVTVLPKTTATTDVHPACTGWSGRLHTWRPFRIRVTPCGPLSCNAPSPEPSLVARSPATEGLGDGSSLEDSICTTPVPF